MAENIAPRLFEFNGGGSDKFWIIELNSKSHTVRYGRQGTDGQTKTPQMPPPITPTSMGMATGQIQALWRPVTSRRAIWLPAVTVTILRRSSILWPQKCVTV